MAAGAAASRPEVAGAGRDVRVRVPAAEAGQQPGPSGMLMICVAVLASSSFEVKSILFIDLSIDL